jgi:2-oxoglutaroyl-CoA hydrolase
MPYAANRPELAALDGVRWTRDPAARAATLVLDRPPLNVVSFRARAQIAAILEEMDRDPEVRVIVIRGANGVYTSGGDIRGFLDVPSDGMADLAWNVAAPERCRKPVIAAIERFAMGVGFELALACDFRLATESAEFALPEINLGTIPGSGGTQRIARIAGLGRAKEMIMRGRRLGAREAFDWGLVSEVVPDDGMDAAVARWVADMAARPSIPLATLKQVLNETHQAPLASGLRHEGQAFEKIRFGAAFKHGIESFLAKKKPDFSEM